MNEAREVFRAEAREGQHIRLIVAGEIDEAVLDGLEDFIAWRRRLEVPVPSTDADV